ncbi:MAG: hypothetical protein KY459_10725 [Acidobacteria bacterium]|nr:hypothetical protein [Acidobacteriota bacterium]
MPPEKRRKGVRLKKTLIFASVVLALFIASLMVGNPTAFGHAIGRLIGPVTVALLLALACIGFGDLSLRIARKIVAEKREPADPAFLLVIGYPLFGGLLFLAGLLSTAPVVVVSLAALAALFGMRALGRERSRKRERLSISLLPGLLLGAAGLISVLMASLPAVSLDEVAYHLAIPDVWLSTGRAVALPLMSHSFFPLGTEAVDLVSLALLGHAGAIASHFLHLMVGLGGVLLILRWLERRGSSLGAFGIAAIVSTPSLLIAAGWSGTDVPLLASTAALFIAIDDFVWESASAARIATALASGLLIKYTFIPLALMLIALALLRSSRRSLLVRAVLLGGIAGSIFFVRNLLLTGNPIEPFLTGETEGIERFRWMGSFGSTFSSYFFFTRYIDDSLGLLLPALALAALASWRRIDEGWLRAAAVAFTGAAMVLMILAPAGRILLPFLLIPAMIGLAAIGIGPEAIAGKVIRGVLVAGTVVQLVMSGLFVLRLDPFPVAFGQMDEQRWLSERRGAQDLIIEGNSVLLDAGRTLVLGLNELFWFEGDVRGGGNFDSQRFVALFSDEDFPERLSEEGITHLLVYPGGIVIDYAPEDPEVRQRLLVLTIESAENLRRFLQEETEIVALTENAGLHRIRAIGESSKR